MEQKTAKMYRWLKRNRWTNPYADFWFVRMRDAEDIDAVAEEMRRWYENVWATIRRVFGTLSPAIREAALGIEKATWPLRYEDDLAESHGDAEDVFV